MALNVEKCLVDYPANNPDFPIRPIFPHDENKWVGIRWQIKDLSHNFQGSIEIKGDTEDSIGPEFWMGDFQVGAFFPELTISFEIRFHTFVDRLLGIDEDIDEFPWVKVTLKAPGFVVPDFSYEMQYYDIFEEVTVSSHENIWFNTKPHFILYCCDPEDDVTISIISSLEPIETDDTYCYFNEHEDIIDLFLSNGDVIKVLAGDDGVKLDPSMLN